MLRAICKVILVVWAAAVTYFAVVVFDADSPTRQPLLAESEACVHQPDAPAAETHIRAAAQFDVVIVGATGFAGFLASRYLATAPGDFKFAIAGRSFNDLHDLDKILADAVKESGHGRESDAMFMFDADDAEDIRKIARKTRVVLSTISPYSKHGSTIIQVCVEEGTHYADLSGDFSWQRNIISRFHAKAQRSGAKIVLAAGYHSLPFDLGAAVALQELDSALVASGSGARASNVTIRAAVTSLRGASIAGLLRALRATREQDPYILVPDATCPVDTSVAGWGRPHYDSNLDLFGVPHVMGLGSFQVVRRSLELLGRRGVSYGEGMSMRGVADAVLFGHWWGARPSEGVQLSGGFTTRIVAVDEASGRSVRVDMRGHGDPDYAHTSKLLAEIGLCLASAQCHRVGMGGGVLTPVSATDTAVLLRRLKTAQHQDKYRSFPLLTVDVVVGGTGRGSTNSEL